MTTTSSLAQVSGAEIELAKMFRRAPRALKRMDRNYWQLFRAIVVSPRKSKRLRPA